MDEKTKATVAEAARLIAAFQQSDIPFEGDIASVAAAALQAASGVKIPTPYGFRSCP